MKLLHFILAGLYGPLATLGEVLMSATKPPPIDSICTDPAPPIRSLVCVSEVQFRYFYDAPNGRCRLFVWGGCDSSRNNFVNEKLCTSTCKGVGPKEADKHLSFPIISNEKPFYGLPLYTSSSTTATETAQPSSTSTAVVTTMTTTTTMTKTTKNRVMTTTTTTTTTAATTTNAAKPVIAVKKIGSPSTTPSQNNDYAYDDYYEDQPKKPSIEIPFLERCGRILKGPLNSRQNNKALTITRQMIPWLTKIASQRSDGEKLFIRYCTGILVSPKWVLTSAYCTKDFAPDLDNITVSLASSNGEILRKITFMYYYPNRVSEADVALLRMADDLDSAVVSTPACLPSYCNSSPASCQLNSAADDYQVSFQFFPKSSNCNITHIARLASNCAGKNVTISSITNLPTAKCGLNSSNSADKSCMARHEDSCNECDIGAPLLCREREQFVLAGLLSTGGPPCRQKKNIQMTRLCKFMPWISQTISTIDFSERLMQATRRK